ncbi:MAG TPA: indolepyruvate oxidoreductase subunit beta [Bacteroidales bacterium]|nr:indolepyruvate oxidoreductase subunit beta [Bacteroidales bacterium]
MKTDIILAGVGGQGILSIAAIVSISALNKGLYIKQSEVHGMSQRGGDVQSNLRLSDKPIYSDLIAEGTADLVLSLEPIEALRYKHYLKKDGWLITNSKPFNNITNYPDEKKWRSEIESYPNHVLIDAEKIAKEIGSVLTANVVLAGAASSYLGLTYNDLENGIREIFGRKGDTVVNMNLEALRRGKAFAEKELLNK